MSKKDKTKNFKREESNGDKKSRKSKKSKSKTSKESHSDRKKPRSGEYGAFADLMDGLANAINIKLWIFLMVILILSNTSEVIEKIIGQVPGTMEGRHLSTKGIFVQSTMVCITMMIIDALISEDLL